MNTKTPKSVQGYIQTCQICSKTNLETILSLGHQPPVHSHVTKEGLHQPDTRYPLNFCRCNFCGLLQLDYAVDPGLLFPPEYPYLTGLTNMLIRNFRSMSESVIQRYDLKPCNLVIDIGSNDGTLLQGFKEKGIRVLGIEPTNAADVAIKNDIPTEKEFFNIKIAKKILKEQGPAKIIAATNMFAHINNLFEFLEGVKLLLEDDGVFVSESQYLMDVIEKLEFDTIYHEHLRFYSLKPLQTLFSATGFSMVHAERISAAGGSIRVYATKGKHPPSPALLALIKAERTKGLYDPKTLRAFTKRVQDAKHHLLELLLKCKREGAQIVGLGAPARSNTLLGYAHITNDILDYAAERKGSPKIGLFTPGAHIPILDEEKIFKDQPKYILILSWHIGDELMKKVRERGYRGKFIMPLPEPRIVTKS